MITGLAVTGFFSLTQVRARNENNKGTRMKTRLSLPGVVLLLGIVCLHSGCMTAGRDFKYQNIAALELGRNRSTEYESTFGLPKAVNVKETADGKFESVSYRYLRVDSFGDPFLRALDLEYRNGVLNAYKYFSNFEADKTTVEIEQLKQIQRGASSKSDVLRVLGKPHGMARCPSHSGYFEDRCKSGAEVWNWTALVKRSITQMQGAQEVKSKARDMNNIFIVFDQAGVVKDLEWSQDKNLY